MKNLNEVSRARRNIPATWSGPRRRGHGLAYISLTCPTAHQTAADPRDL